MIEYSEYGLQLVMLLTVAILLSKGKSDQQWSNSPDLHSSSLEATATAREHGPS